MISGFGSGSRGAKESDALELQSPKDDKEVDCGGGNGALILFIPDLSHTLLYSDPFL